MPGVPHGRRDGLSTVINNLRTTSSAIGQQQSYPDLIEGDGPYTITAGDLAPLPTPLTKYINGSASLTFLVGLSAIISTTGYTAGSLVGEVFFQVNGNGVSGFPLQMSTGPITVSGTPYAQGLSISCSATYLISSNAGVGIPVTGLVGGGNLFEVLAASSVSGEITVSGVTLWALPC